MELNKRFTANIQTVHGEAGVAWLHQLPQVLAKLSQEWDFEFVQTMPILSYNFVGSVRMNRNNKLAILKIGPPQSSIATEIKWLSRISNGAPAVYNFDLGANAFLMEFVQPGSPLKDLVQAGRDDEATRIVCRVIQDLQTKNQLDLSFPHLAELSKSFSALDGYWEKPQLARAKDLFLDLTKERSDDVLLHGDLHHDNILSSGNTWKAIDPHGYRGDPAAEVGAMIRNPYDAFPKGRSVSEVIQRRLSILHEELPFDAQRINAWAYCLTVLSAAWAAEDNLEISEIQKEVAATIYKLI